MARLMVVCVDEPVSFFGLGVVLVRPVERRPAP